MPRWQKMILLTLRSPLHAIYILHNHVGGGHTEPKWPTRWSAVNLPNWLLHLYLADLLVLLLLEVVVEVEVV